MMSIWDAPSDRDVLSTPYDRALDDEEPPPEMPDIWPADSPTEEPSSFTDEEAPF